MPPQHSESDAVSWLLTSQAVRLRVHQMLALAERDALPHFVHFPERLPATIDYVLATIHHNYPTLDIPFHSRWRHFSAGGRDRWGEMSTAIKGRTREDVARIRFDLAVVSVLLDAGAGPAWSFHEPGGSVYIRSEGLAVASYSLFHDGMFSADPGDPWRADAAALIELSSAALAAALQVTPNNHLVGLDGRAELLRRLGTALACSPEIFGAAPRIGAMFDYLRARAVGGVLPATEILATVLRGLGPVWPGRLTLGGVNLGDVWRHSAIRAEDKTNGLVPFHKLSQWLAYSLIEPIDDAGIRVTGIETLTGLAEYRNGGLMIDLGLIALRDPTVTMRRLKPGDEPVVEWRALTLALLDRIADGLRARLGLTEDAFPLARVLEGGTWSAGRRAAREHRPDGNPPLVIISDGTVF